MGMENADNNRASDEWWVADFEIRLFTDSPVPMSM
jgi:hypothetical protein